LIAGSVVAHAYLQRYEIAAAGGGLVVRLDRLSGRLSACTQFETTGSSVVSRQIKILTGAGFKPDEIAKYLTEHEGQMVCSAWNE
jgi:hypothetical protein